MYKALQKLEWDKILDYLCDTALSEFVKEKIKKLVPVFDFEKALVLQRQTKFVFELLDVKDINLIPLKSLTENIEKAKKRGFFLPLELCEIKKWFFSVKPLLEHVRSSPFESLLEIYEELKEVEKKLDTILDYGKREIKDKASYNLFIIRKKIRENTELLYSKIEKLKEYFYKKGYLQENMYTQKEGRYVLPVKIEYKNKVKGIVHDFSSSGATAFIEPLSIVSLTNEIEELKFQEQREEVKILREISEEIFQREKIFERFEQVYTEFEIAFAKARLGKLYRGIFPELKKEGSLKILKGVHPFLIFSTLKNPSYLRNPVPNDFKVEKGLLITGPNLGGKTVALKTIGILVLMAQAGFLLPAQQAEIPIFNQIFVDMGDDQDIFLGESSFSSHLKVLKEILDKAQDKSLILLDEPGRGTDPEQGLSLVAAIIEEMLKRKVVMIVTTHSLFLKTLILKLGNFKIASMEYDIERKEPTYKLIYDEWGDSLAFDLAKKIGIPEHVILKANDYLKNKNYLEWHRLWEKKLEKIRNLEKELVEKEKRLKDLERILEEKERELKEKYVKTLEEKIKTWETRFKDFLKKFDERVTNKKKMLESFEKFTGEFLRDTLLEEEPLKEGDVVLIKSLNKKGKVLRVKQGTVEIYCGNLKLEVPVEKVVRLEREDISSSLKSVFSEKKEKISYDKIYLNVMGMTVEEALNEIDKALNKAFLQGYPKLYIVHGHGTGKLRDAVQKFLKDHVLVKEFKFADLFEGGTGVTIVYLENKE